ncbi:MAG: hypothetical protein H0T79_08240, partial [Deltaproteobacteria bacterium]|nr:hypothetical protein [Deltaproteobacteria bacterium]
LRKFGDELFVVNRTSNNVTILNATTFALVEQLATGAATNPQDVAVHGSKLYVPALSGKGVLVLTRGSTTVTEIDLSADDPDGKPNCESVYLVDTMLFVACGLLDDADPFLSPRGPGRVYVIDTATDTRTATVTLTSKNPLGLFERSPVGSSLGGDLVIPTVDFGANNAGCIERISTGATPAANGCVVTNAALGGFANRVDFQTAETGEVMLWLAVSEAFPNASLRGYDLAASSLWDPITPMTQVITDVIGCPGGRVVVADQKMDAAGIRVLENTVEKTTTPLNIGLAPKSAHGLVCY